jgi:hypothetical protein
MAHGNHASLARCIFHAQNLELYLRYYQQDPGPWRLENLRKALQALDAAVGRFLQAEGAPEPPRPRRAAVPPRGPVVRRLSLP